MAKGKHAPAKGAIREDKVIHPKSRKAAKMHLKEQRKLKMAGKTSVGGQRLQVLGEKLLWFHDNLQLILNDEDLKMSQKNMLDLISAYIDRNEAELEQINLKNSIGGGQFKKRNQHQSRLDAIVLAKKTESEEFEGCGLEVPDLLDTENLNKFKDWNGELRFVQNFKLKRMTKKGLLEAELASADDDVNDMIIDS